MMYTKIVSSVFALFVAVTATDVTAQMGDEEEWKPNRHKLAHNEQQQQTTQQELRQVVNQQADSWMIRFNDDGTVDVMVIGDTDIQSVCDDAQSIDHLGQLTVSNDSGRRITC